MSKYLNLKCCGFYFWKFFYIFNRLPFRAESFRQLGYMWTPLQFSIQRVSSSMGERLISMQRSRLVVVGWWTPERRTSFLAEVPLVACHPGRPQTFSSPFCPVGQTQDHQRPSAKCPSEKYKSSSPCGNVHLWMFAILLANAEGSLFIVQCQEHVNPDT